MKRSLLLATAVLIAATPRAEAQSLRQQLPPDPAAAAAEDTRLNETVPPDPAPPAVPVAPAGPGEGPVFVLRGVTLIGATAVAPGELEPLWADLLGAEVSIATLETLAAQIGAAYRARGFVLSQAVLPAQTVDDGVVQIQVIEGFIDRVALIGGAPNQQALAQTLFAPVSGSRPLRLATLERAVLLSRDTFGGTVETALEPSPDTFAAADLTVGIEPDPWTGFAAIDNRGSRLYGAWTATAGGSAYNLLGLNERIDLLGAAAVDGSLGYLQGVFDVPLPGLDTTALDGARLELTADISDADPDLSEAGSPDDLIVTLDEWNVGATLFVPFIRTRPQNLFGRIGLNWRDSESGTDFATDRFTETDRLLVLEARMTWDRADRFGGVTLLDARLRQGLSTGGTRIGADGPAAGSTEFTALAVTLARLQRIGDTPLSLYAEGIGQMASTVLPSSERFALGGGTIGRGFAPGNTSGDSGLGGRLELRGQVAPERIAGAIEAVELYAFGDYGQAVDRSFARDGNRYESLGSVGIGARIDLRDWLTITPEVVRQTEGQADDTTRTSHQTRAFIGAVARF
jgi:hemolysin activation/secretion protein